MPLGEAGFKTFLFHHFSYKAHTSPPVIAEIAKNILHGFPGGKWLLFLRLYRCTLYPLQAALQRADAEPLIQALL